jgi:hypothetical protein
MRAKWEQKIIALYLNGGSPMADPQTTLIKPSLALLSAVRSESPTNGLRVEYDPVSDVLMLDMGSGEFDRETLHRDLAIIGWLRLGHTSRADRAQAAD